MMGGVVSPTDGDRTRSTRAALLGLPGAAEPLLFEIRAPEGTTTVRLPASGNVIVGRSRDCDVSIDHDSVSRRHALLHVGSQLLIQDLGSRNGTRVETRALSPRMVTEIELGVPLLVGSVTCVVRRAADAAESRRTTTADPPESMKEESERRRIARILAECGGNQTKAAKLLGISRRTLVTRLGAYGLPRPRKGRNG
jgi:pSer/pThr/pTyr-binding forkhead associated (FHA) protein